MSTTPLITPDLVAIGLVAADREEATRHLVNLMFEAGRVTDAGRVPRRRPLREAQMATGMPGGVGLPHARSGARQGAEPCRRAGPGGVDFGAPDGPATLVFLIAAPATGDADHLKILAALARRLVHESFRTLAEGGSGRSDRRRHHHPRGRAFMKFVAVTSCPTGIAHTYMAAEALEQVGKAQGHEVTVETQGSAGSTRLDPAIIAAADGVIFAADLEVQGKERFAGKPTVDVGVKAAVHDAAAVLAKAVAAVEAAPKGGPAASAAPVRVRTAQEGRRRHPYPPVADDRCVLHAALRRRGRHPHRLRLHARSGGLGRERRGRGHVDHRQHLGVRDSLRRGPRHRAR